jgi:hypothetical protein
LPSSAWAEDTTFFREIPAPSKSCCAADRSGPRAFARTDLLIRSEAAPANRHALRDLERRPGRLHRPLREHRRRRARAAANFSVEARATTGTMAGAGATYSGALIGQTSPRGERPRPAAVDLQPQPAAVSDAAAERGRTWARWSGTRTRWPGVRRPTSRRG